MHPPRPPRTHFVISAALLLGAWLGMPLPAIAHAFLDHAEPRVGSKVREAPRDVRLWFTQDLEPAFSWVKVLNEAGQQIDRRDVRVDPSKRSILEVSVPPLPPGTYRVQWHVLSVDTHVTEGDFKFRIAP